MLAVCGEGAASGSCEHSVAQQISTMPSWLYGNLDIIVDHRFSIIS